MTHGLSTPHNARVIYVDLNAFFASCEQQTNPAFRDKPLAVVSHLTPSGSVLASSYQAKFLGITTGTRLREAKQRCPDLITVETDAAKYQAYHRRFREVLEDVGGPETQMRSIDEAAISLPSNYQTSEQARSLALALKQAIAQRLGKSIRCSIGIAPNILLAKLATDLDKPDGLLEISLENTPSILSRLRLTQLPGIADRAAALLINQDITTPLDLYNTSADRLRALYGIWGQYWWWRLHGLEPDGYESNLKSVSHEHVLKEWIYYRGQGWPVFNKMADHLIYRLRRNHLQCTHLGLYLKLTDHSYLAQERKFDVPTGSYTTLLRSLQELYQNLPSTFPEAARKMVLSSHGLSSTHNNLQLDLFQQRPAQEAVSQAIDHIRLRHGKEAIQIGSVVGISKSVAKEQPGFGKIRDTSNF